MCGRREGKYRCMGVCEEGGRDASGVVSLCGERGKEGVCVGGGRDASGVVGLCVGREGGMDMCEEGGSLCEEEGVFKTTFLSCGICMILRVI